MNGSALIDNAAISDATRAHLWESVRRELDRMQRLLSEKEQKASQMDLDETMCLILDLQRLKGRHVELRSHGETVRARYDALAEVVNILMDNAATHGGSDSSLIEVAAATRRRWTSRSPTSAAASRSRTARPSSSGAAAGPTRPARASGSPSPNASSPRPGIVATGRAVGRRVVVRDLAALAPPAGGGLVGGRARRLLNDEQAPGQSSRGGRPCPLAPPELSTAS